MKELINEIRALAGDITMFVKTFFMTSDAIQEDLSRRWRPHANRRTLVILATIGTFAYAGYVYVVEPPIEFPVHQLITVSADQSVEDISYALEAQGVIQSPLAFRVAVRVLGTDRSLRAGDYLFKEPKDLISVARAISLGAFGLEPEKIRIPEGATTRSMAIIYKSRLLRFDDKKFLELAQPQEGFLYPDTYFFLPNATEETVINAMRQAFDDQMKPFQSQVSSSSLTIKEIITLASIIEREASKTDDRHMISGVLYNRLEKGMPLQVDVTFLYTMGKNSFQLTLDDLRSDNPYNTYVHKGLPPGPIGSPSLDSIHAALYPEKHKYIFYLADNTGVTHYSRTYEEHLAKKRLYLGT